MCNCNSEDNKEIIRKLDYIVERIDKMETFIHGKSDKYNPDLMNVRSASKYCQLAVSTVYQYVYYKKIPHIKKGHKILFSKKALDEWLPVAEKRMPERPEIPEKDS